MEKVQRRQLALRGASSPPFRRGESEELKRVYRNPPDPHPSRHQRQLTGSLPGQAQDDPGSAVLLEDRARSGRK